MECIVCGHPAEAIYHRGPCPRPYLRRPPAELWDDTRADPETPVRVAETPVKTPVRRVETPVKRQTMARKTPVAETPVAEIPVNCRGCGGPLAKPARGPMPAYCSERCRSEARRTNA